MVQDARFQALRWLIMGPSLASAPAVRLQVLVLVVPCLPVVAAAPEILALVLTAGGIMAYAQTFM